LFAWSVFAFENVGQEGDISVNKVDKPATDKGYVPPSTPAKPPAQQPATTTPPPPATDKK
jgi:hypothetical protein